MSGWSPSEVEARSILEDQILPTLFPSSAPEESPTLVLMVGQPGSGPRRVTSRVLRDHPGMAVLSIDELRAFHPHYVELSRSRSVEASQIVAETTVGWLRDCLAYARTAGRSLVLEGAVRSPQLAFGSSQVFARHGFHTRLVGVGVPRAESLLAVTSEFLREQYTGRAGRWVSVRDHDAALDAAIEIVAVASAETSVDRVSIFGRDGETLFDSDGSTQASFPGASAALRMAQGAPMTNPTAMRWLSELRAATDFARTTGSDRGVVDALLELHRVALREVSPQLRLPAESQARATMEASLARQIVALRELRPPRTSVAPAPSGPVITPPQPDRGISR